jgi:hypothetical protein
MKRSSTVNDGHVVVARKGGTMTAPPKPLKTLELTLNAQPLGGEILSEYTDNRCLKSMDGGMTVHTRHVTVWWFSPCPPELGVDCATGAGCTVTHYDDWVDTGEPCGVNPKYDVATSPVQSMSVNVHVDLKEIRPRPRVLIEPKRATR